MITHTEARRAVDAYCKDTAARLAVEGTEGDVYGAGLRGAAAHAASTVGSTIGVRIPANDNMPVAPARPGPGAYLRGPHDVEYKLDCLPRGLIYLGSPYSLYKQGLHMAARHASRAAAALMRHGLVVYAPISHGHAIACDNDLPVTWEFWKAQCQPYIDAAAALVVLKLEGWEESVGLTYEIDEFGRQGKPIVFVAPEDLAFKEETIEEEWKRRVG